MDIETVLSGDGIEPITSAKTLNATQAFFGPTGFNLVGDDSVHDNLRFFNGAINDQRGQTRPVDLASITNAVGGNGSDIGAYESQGAPAYPHGDYNEDGLVNAADYTVWRDALSDTVPPGTGADGSRNGLIDQADYDIWAANYGNTDVASPASRHRRLHPRGGLRPGLAAQRPPRLGRAEPMDHPGGRRRCDRGKLWRVHPRPLPAAHLAQHDRRHGDDRGDPPSRRGVPDVDAGR